MASTLAGLVIAVTGNGPTTLAIAVGGLLLTLLAEATRTAISGRRRPILSDRAHRADTRMRSFAGTSVAFLQLAAAVLVAGWVVSKALRTANDLVEIVRFCAVIGSLVLTVVIVRKASPRPPRR